MLIRKRTDIAPSEITDRRIFLERRRLLAGIAALAAAPQASAINWLFDEAQPVHGPALAGSIKSPLSTMETPTPWKDAVTYNNFIELGQGKSTPARQAQRMKTRPWSVAVEGEIKKPIRFDLDALLKLAPLEERIYRFRCVEGWSMVVPWIGFPLAELIKRVEPNGNARFVEFVSLADPATQPGVASPLFDWPYVEGLRLDEAMHPLTLLAAGHYGEVLANQSGAPIRLVVPWKYGFKSAKSIVKIRFVREQPRTLWNLAAPDEYGFYANVNPGVDHPRWSQASERRLGDFRKRATQAFNGYAEQVASLYAGMDLRKNF